MNVPVGPDRFRRVLGCLAGGVAIVTSRDAEGEPRGMTATAVCSVSLEPPLVLACLDRNAKTHGAVEAARVYALNFLGESDVDLARRFSEDALDKFADLAFTTRVTGAPVLERALAYCDCSVVECVRAGDHTIFIGRVESAGYREMDEATPLVHYRGDYRNVHAGSAGKRDETDEAR